MNSYSLFTKIIFYCYLTNFYRVRTEVTSDTYEIKVPYVRNFNNFNPLIINAIILVVFLKLNECFFKLFVILFFLKKTTNVNAIRFTNWFNVFY